MKHIPLSLLQHQFGEMLRALPSERLLANLGMGIYQTAYQIRMHEALEEDFPQTRKFLGDEDFSKLIGSYFRSHASQSWTLAELGNSLDRFVARGLWGGRFPFLPDLVRLEWLRVLADHAETSERLNLEDIPCMTDQELQAIILSLVPSAFLFRSDWSVHTDFTRLPSHLVVYRNSAGKISEIELLEEEWLLLRRISGGISVREIVNLVPLDSQQTVTQWFSNWAAQGIIIRINFKGDSQ